VREAKRRKHIQYATTMPPRRSGLVDARRRRGGSAICSPTTPIWRDGNHVAVFAGDDLAEYKDLAVASIARIVRRRSHRNMSVVGPAHMPGDWTWSSSCSLRIGSATISAGCCCRQIESMDWPAPGPIVLRCFGSPHYDFATPSRGAGSAAEIGVQLSAAPLRLCIRTERLIAQAGAVAPAGEQQKLAVAAIV